MLILGTEELAERVKGKTLALMMNHSALTNDGKHLVDVIHGEWDADVQFLFGMEHGVRGELSAGVKVESRADPLTGLPVVSLYDFPALRPPVGLVAKVDAVVFSAQDAGVRHWTYTPWMMFCMDAAAQAGTELIVVDRPNPMGGAIVEGSVVDPEYFSIIGGFAYPYRHGMTIGELALMYNDTYKVGCALHVVPMQGWTRNMWYDQTGLFWTPPSPNIPVLETLVGYATTGMLQSTTVSFGRGTTIPFNVFGAPWIDGFDLAGKINRMAFPGLFCVGKYFIPRTDLYADQVCSGVYLICTDRERYRPVTTAIHILSMLFSDYSGHMGFTSAEAFDKRAGTSSLREKIEAGEAPDGIAEEWAASARKFEDDRIPYLLY